MWAEQKSWQGRRGEGLPGAARVPRQGTAVSTHGGGGVILQGTPAPAGKASPRPKPERTKRGCKSFRTNRKLSSRILAGGRKHSEFHGSIIIHQALYYDFYMLL